MGVVIPREGYCKYNGGYKIIILNQLIEVQWDGRTKDHYVSKGYIFSKMREKFLVSVEYLTPHCKSVVDVECDCCKKIYSMNYGQALRANRHICSSECLGAIDKIDAVCFICKKNFQTIKSQLEKSKSGNLFCSNACVGKYNAIQRANKVNKICTICSIEYSIKPSEAKNSVTCSVECQHKWQSAYLRGKNANNFKGGNIEVTCIQCNKLFYGRRYAVLNGSKKFCSIECKQKHWGENVPLSEDFKSARYDGILRVRQNPKKETNPERIIRELLELYNINYVQEKGFFGKYFADFWLINTNIVIEVFGDYWHGNTDIFAELNDFQKQQIIYDKKRLSDFKKCGFNVIVLWENDIKINAEELIKNKLLTIYPRNDYTQDIH